MSHVACRAGQFVPAMGDPFVGFKWRARLGLKRQKKDVHDGPIETDGSSELS